MPLMSLKKLAYFDENAATSWVPPHEIGKKLVNELVGTASRWLIMMI
ncbi:hypothetical protein [Vulcanisaeta distributa]|nr:hypothetical protein [Vulcanisaeta distributa]